MFYENVVNFKLKHNLWISYMKEHLSEPIKHLINYQAILLGHFIEMISVCQFKQLIKHYRGRSKFNRFSIRLSNSKFNIAIKLQPYEMEV